MNDYEAHWKYLESPRPIWIGVGISFVLHVAGGAWLINEKVIKKPDPISIAVHEVKIVNLPTPEPVKKEEEKPPPPPPPKPDPKPEPKPEPKKEEPKPKPKPKPEPEPVAKKEEPKPKPKPKPEPKKEEPKPEPKTPPKPEPEVKKEYRPKTPQGPVPEVIAKAPEVETGVQKEQLPTILSAWGRAVQRKVEKYWRVPAGIQVVEENMEVHLSFTVDRDGNIIAGPRITKNALDLALGEAGISAIKLAEPLPPLPNEFRENRQEVVYVFSLSREKRQAS